MLVSLSIKNYALIENLKVDFKDRLSIITGETGAGKSILMGGLALVLGKRADSSLVYDKVKKCVIEAEFQVSSYHLESFFEANDLDYDPWVIIRREILPNGKSRAFVNDTPTNLSILNELTSQLIDIHSQHETLQLSDPSFQFHIIDALSNNASYLNDYNLAFQKYKALIKELQAFEELQLQAKKEYDYNLFLWEELEKADLKVGEQEDLEKDLEKLSHVEEIKLSLAAILDISEQEPLGALNQMSAIDQQLSKIEGYADLYGSMSERMKSVLIEFKDLLAEIADENDNLVYDPAALENVEDRLQTLYDLQKKHATKSIEELLVIKEAYHSKITDVDNAEETISNASQKIQKAELSLNKIALKIRKRRLNAIPEFKSQIESALGALEMKNTRFKVALTESEDFLLNGKDKLQFLMSSDKGKSFETMKKVASGGEMSRMMLAVKWILSKYSSLPAIIFDEIDTGVSGEVSNRIADVMLAMSQNMQVITITHLPQVAAKGHHHYKVFKEDNKDGISSNIKLMNSDERLVELAQMLGGSAITDSAMAHAKQLLS
ncbi:DNA repair protein RecN [Lutimonas halocynthiae]|uniref:DNA repair protein RecN n=1 Tax=Lutimonas halocynthiae TaxID=1446477 RepID=UPI0025B30E4E|nr:DNA repair protein RecN [Lutimonas halocynthiae]MDN3644357.1 DNA repair protein RecN [Lutimonas halocynthiae]